MTQPPAVDENAPAPLSAEELEQLPNVASLSAEARALLRTIGDGVQLVLHALEEYETVTAAVRRLGEQRAWEEHRLAQTVQQRQGVERDIVERQEELARAKQLCREAWDESLRVPVGHATHSTAESDAARSRKPTR